MKKWETRINISILTLFGYRELSARRVNRHIKRFNKTTGPEVCGCHVSSGSVRTPGEAVPWVWDETNSRSFVQTHCFYFSWSTLMLAPAGIVPSWSSTTLSFVDTDFEYQSLPHFKIKDAWLYIKVRNPYLQDGFITKIYDI